MFEGFSQQTIDFLWGIRLNNNKSWYDEHKDDYKEHLAKPMKALCDELYCDFCKEIGYNTVSSVSRLAKDARFPHAYPYRDNFWFTFKEPIREWWALPAFYFELTCEGWSYGMGTWSATAVSMQNLRNAIDDNRKEFEKLAKDFGKKGIMTLEGDFYKRKKGEISPVIDEWYNRKNFNCFRAFTYDDKTVFDRSLLELILNDFRELYPLARFLHKAMKSEE